MLLASLRRRPVARLLRSLHHAPRKGDKVVVAMSGGVDSSVTAALLAHRSDYDLSAVFMRNWDSTDDSTSESHCTWEKDWADVQRVCAKLGMPARMVDLSKEYWTRVFEPAVRMWERGQTPNPDVWCNREVKFGALMDRLALGEEGTEGWLATGHYARKDYHAAADGSLSSRLMRHPSIKDQTYYLASIPLPALARTIFPLGNPPHLPGITSGAALSKDDVRSLAQKWDLHTAGREESMGLCFVGERKRFGDFVSQYIPPSSGPIISLPTGAQLGTHNGVWNFTVGQGARVPGCNERLFVVRKTFEDGVGTVWVAPGDHPAQLTSSLTTDGFSWIWPTPPPGLTEGDGVKVRVRVRHRGEDYLATIKLASNEPHSPLHITFATPQKAIAPGQIAVVYDADGEWCMGCGVIEGTECLG